MREAGPLPILNTKAVCSSIASTSLKSSGSVVTFSLFQVDPPLLVRKTVLPEPLAQATFSFTALTPRRRAVTPLCCMIQCGAATKSDVMIMIGKRLATLFSRLGREAAFIKVIFGGRRQLLLADLGLFQILFFHGLF